MYKYKREINKRKNILVNGLAWAKPWPKGELPNSSLLNLQQGELRVFFLHGINSKLIGIIHIFWLLKAN
jgi:hypothetical protein